MAVKRNTRLRNTRSRLKQGNPRVRSRGEGFHVGRYILLVVVLGAFVWLAVRPALARIAELPVFTIRNVVVEGAERLDRERILKSASIQAGANIFRVDLEHASQSLRKEFAAEDFVLFRRLPDTIVIRVKERRPVALINTDQLVGVDAQGVLLPHIGADMVESLPIITGVNSVASLSEPETRKRLLAGLKLLNAIYLQSPAVHKRISEVNVSSAATMGINLIDNGLEVIIGENGWTEKLPNLEKVISQVTGRMDSVRSVDMRFGEKIFIRRVLPARNAAKSVELKTQEEVGNHVNEQESARERTQAADRRLNKKSGNGAVAE